MSGGPGLMWWSLAGLSSTTVALLAAIGVSTLTALYLLRLGRRRIVVPLIALWLPAEGEPLANRLALRLRRLVSLMLQLLIFALLLAAAGDPRASPSGDERTGRSVAVLIDRSASMQALDEAGSRLERARALARATIDQLGPNDRALVATFGATVSAMTGVERDHDRLRAAVDAIEATDETGLDLGAASSFAAALLNGLPSPTVVLITDGGGADGAAHTPGILVDAGVDIRYLAVGRRRDNVAIVSFSARRLPADPAAVELVLVTRSFRSAPSEVTVAITAGPARIPVARRRVRLESGGRAVTTVAGVEIADSRLEATLEDTRDDLSLDDHAYAVVPRSPPLKVLVVGARPNLFLDGALMGMATNVEIDRLPTSSAALTSTETGRARTTDGRPEKWIDHDIVIFDGVTPSAQPQAGQFLYLDPHGPHSPWPERGMVRDPVVTETAREHPLMKRLSLADMNVLTARRLSLSRGDVAVAAAVGTPLVIARDLPGLRQVALAFDVRHSDLPLRSAFPLFLANAFDWLAHRAPAQPLSWPTGRTERIDIGGWLASGPRSVPPTMMDVVTPNGRVLRTPVTAGTLTVALDRVGLVTVRSTDGQALGHIAVNLASAVESELQPRATKEVAGRRLIASRDARGTAGAPASDRMPTSRRPESWVLLLGAAIALAAFEWVSFRRRLTV